MRNNPRKIVSFETFVRKTKSKDRMAAGFWYRIYELSNLSLVKWLGTKPAK